MTHDEFLKELEEQAGIVNQSLEQFLPSPETYPTLIHQAMRYSLFAGGKRLRPVLVMAVARTVGEESVRVLPAACALELIHTYSLIHDDLPAMDNDDLRRGKPTCHRVYGEAIAVLAGDALLTLAFELMVCRALQQFIPAGRILKTIGEIAGAAGTAGMIGGQVMDILAENAEIDSRTLEYIHRHKTGALYRAAVRAGAILAGAGESQLSALTEYAENLGLAFQIKDDILNVEGDDARLGKPAGSDKKNKKATYPVLFGMSTARAKAAYAAATAKESLRFFDHQADFLRAMADYVVNRDF